MLMKPNERLPTRVGSRLQPADIDERPRSGTGRATLGTYNAGDSKRAVSGWRERWNDTALATGTATTVTM